MFPLLGCGVYDRAVRVTGASYRLSFCTPSVSKFRMYWIYDIPNWQLCLLMMASFTAVALAGF